MKLPSPPPSTVEALVGSSEVLEEISTNSSIEQSPTIHSNPLPSKPSFCLGIQFTGQGGLEGGSRGCGLNGLSNAP